MIDINIFNTCGVNPYKLLSPRQKIEWRNEEFANMLFESIMMFDYKKSKEYEHIEDRTIETTLLLNGLNGWCEDEQGNIVVGFAFDGGKRDINNIGHSVSITCLNGKGYHKNIDNKECVIGLNNATCSSEMQVFRYADMFAEVDLSQLNNIKYTRLYPLFVAKSRKVAQLLKDFFNGLKIGEPVKIADDGMLGNKQSIESVNITDVNAIDKLQYLSTYHNDLLRRFFTTYGLPLSEGMKQAQQSIEEIDSSTARSLVKPLDMLKQRKAMCEKLVDTFGGSITVDFKEPWKTEFEKYMKKVEVNINENI